MNSLTRLTLSILILVVATANAQRPPNEWEIASPDGQLKARIFIREAALFYTVQSRNAEVIEPSELGLRIGASDLANGISILKATPAKLITDDYEMAQGKRRLCSYRGNERVLTVRGSDQRTIDLSFRVSNDGVAFRYTIPESGKKDVVTAEVTSFNLPKGTIGFLQPMSKAKTGWSKVNPCYEEFYQKGVPAESASAEHGWVYPALFKTGDHWVLISEAGLSANYCATHLGSASPEGKFSIAFPQPEEFFPGGKIEPEGEGHSPWRIILVGGLKTVIESTLGTDLADPVAKDFPMKKVKTGQSSWSWALLKDDSTVFDVQKKFIDYAANMKWEYCLVDASWDQMIGYDKIKTLSAYAKSKGVGLLLWYNSAGSWNDTPYTPKSKLISHDVRVKEFARLKEMGIAGVKIDFFGGDGQSFIRYYVDILKDAAAYDLLVNFHGSTIPRGWQRTYPNLMSCEAIKGFEYVTFDQRNADEEPVHGAIIPFTRNAFDPMDFTPLSLTTVPGINRKTSPSYELALSVVFLSGIQHFVETPSGMKKVPVFVQDFLKGLPDAWDETRFIAGYPGDHVVIARRSGKRWYVGGINGKSSPTSVKVKLSELATTGHGYSIADGKDASGFMKTEITSTNEMDVEMPAHGGFTIVFGEN
jgi:hypothetical protein